MSTAASIPPARRRAWIVSPTWDLVYLVLTPVLIVPAVLLAGRRWLEPEQIYLAVISFASLGHHLPGFMRAYGDRELFARYRWRFLLAPPLVFALALAFTPPRSMAQAFSLPWSHLHGLELVLLVWGTWHGLMQTYGFMRIYDLRCGDHDRRTARLDHALCVAMFVAGVLFSDTRMFGVASAMGQTGLPLFGPQTLSSLRWIVGGAGALIAAAYLLHLVDRRRRRLPINWVKLLLAGATGWFYWYCGRLSTNVLIGVAMFEIYHAVQYNAIVWIYNRRLFERAGGGSGLVGFLFRDRATMLGLYLATIAAYSSIRFFSAASGDRMFGGDAYDARQGLIALFVTSSILHFYYDGFIWKVSDRKTGQNLTDDATTLPAVDRLTPAMVHSLKWAVLLAIVAALVAAERRSQNPAVNQRQLTDRRTLEALAALTPDVPEARRISQQLAEHDADERYRAGLELLKQGQAAEAVEPLHAAVKLNPRHFQANLQLGDALIAASKPQAAENAFAKAIELRPDVPDARIGLADAQIKSGRLAAAEATLRAGLQRNPQSPELAFTLAILLEQTSRSNEAAELFQRAAEGGLSR